MKIMLADDEQAMRTLIERIVVDEGYEYCDAQDGFEALKVFKEKKPDLVILDVMMPELDGFQVCRAIRDIDSMIPIIFLSAKGDIVDKRVGFECGGDDYLVKPFEPQELSLRIKAHLRKTSTAVAEQQTDHFSVKGFDFDTKKRKVSIKGKPIDLTTTEFDILVLLASHPGEIFTREQLTKEIWGEDFVGEVTSLSVFIRKIREKIEEDPSDPRYLQTVWRAGYRFGDL